MASPAPGRMLPLSDLEVGMIGAPPIDLLLRYQVRLDPEMVERGFREALRQADVFASRLVQLGDDRFGLVSDPEGATFTVRPPASAEHTAFELDAHGALMERVRGLPGDPLVAASCTPLTDGTLVGLSVSHVVGDGGSLVRFMAMWIAAARGIAVTWPDSRRSYRHGSVAAPPPSPPPPLPDAIARRAAFYRALRRECRSELVTSDEVEALWRRCQEHDGSVTRQQAVVAHLLKKHAAAMVPDASHVRVRTPVDIRGLHPAVSWDYLGNAFVDALVGFTRAQLESASVAELAAAIGASIAEIRDPARLARRLSWTEHGLEQPAAPGEPIAPESDIVCSNLAKLGSVVHTGADFGSGPAVSTHIAFIAPTGFILTSNVDGIDVRIVHPVAGGAA